MVTVREIISLDEFNQFKLIAGKNGLDNTVIRGGIIDYESPKDLLEENIRDEMLLSNLPMIKDKPERIVEYIKALIESRTACLAIKTTLFKEIPQEAINLANKFNYPLFIFDDCYLDRLVIAIDKFIDKEHTLSKRLELIDKIYRNRNKYNVVKAYVKKMNKYFLEYLIVYRILYSNTNKFGLDFELAQNLLGKSSLVLPVDDGCLIIFSSDESNLHKDILIQKLGLQSGDYYIGASLATKDHGLLGNLLYESEIALYYSRFKEKFISGFGDLGIYQLLIPVLKEDKLPQFYKNIVHKIIDYDKKYSSELLKTARAYIKADGSIKKTAEFLYQHENTVRFRMRKLKEVINYDANQGVKYETLVIAIHLYELYEHKKIKPTV